MKNPYAKVTHLKKRKFKLVLRLFCEDLSATQIARLANVNRKTCNLWLGRIRERISVLAKAEEFTDATSVQVDESFFGGAIVPGTNRRWPMAQIIVVGLITDGVKVRVEMIRKVEKSQILPVIHACCAPGAIVHTDGCPVYKALPVLGYKHASVSHVDDEFSRYENGVCVTTNRIESFWDWSKNRLAKFNGIRLRDFRLHIKECEWRFNHRQDDIYTILLREFRKYPLSNLV